MSRPIMSGYHISWTFDDVGYYILFVLPLSSLVPGFTFHVANDFLKRGFTFHVSNVLWKRGFTFHVSNDL